MVIITLVFFAQGGCCVVRYHGWEDVGLVFWSIGHFEFSCFVMDGLRRYIRLATAAIAEPQQPSDDSLDFVSRGQPNNGLPIVPAAIPGADRTRQREYLIELHLHEGGSRSFGPTCIHLWINDKAWTVSALQACITPNRYPTSKASKPRKTRMHLPDVLEFIRWQLNKPCGDMGIGNTSGRNGPA